MSTIAIPTDVEDRQAVIAAFLAGRPVDPDVAFRVHERADEIRKRMIAEYGLQDIGVPFLRQARETSH